MHVFFTFFYLLFPVKESFKPLNKPQKTAILKVCFKQIQFPSKILVQCSFYLTLDINIDLYMFPLPFSVFKVFILFWQSWRVFECLCWHGYGIPSCEKLFNVLLWRFLKVETFLVHVFQVLMCKDYVLIKGYPGTGKK